MKITLKDNKILTLGGKTFSLVPTMYDVTCEDDGHGSIIATPNRGTKGSLIELSNTPNEGYLLDYYTVDDVQIQGNTFTLQNDCTVFGKFKEEPLPFNTVQIGNKIWSDYIAIDDGGTGIYTVTDPSYWETITGTYYYYDGTARNRIVNRFSSKGWRIPTVSDWNSLYSYAGSNVKKLMSTYGWGYDSSYDGTDNYGFCLLPLGYYSTYSSNVTYVNQYGFLFCTTSQSIKVNYDGTVDTTNWIGNSTPAPLRLVKNA